VAPNKKQTIPRLELLGATILARLESNISKALSLNVQEFYWVDSTATLCWIRNERLWKQYIQNRVTEIRKLSSPEMWHFYPGILRFGNLKKLLRVTAYVLRFVNALKKAKQHEGSRDLKFLSTSEI
jgi:hypothetical protein